MTTGRGRLRSQHLEYQMNSLRVAIIPKGVPRRGVERVRLARLEVNLSPIVLEHHPAIWVRGDRDVHPG